MKITPKFDFLSGSFDTDQVSLVCVSSAKYGTVELCVKDPECGANISIGEIKLYSSDRFCDAIDTLPDAIRLGDEIARRWNEVGNKHKEEK